MLSAYAQRAGGDPVDRRHGWRLDRKTGHELLDRGRLTLGLDHHTASVVGDEPPEMQCRGQPVDELAEAFAVDGALDPHPDP